MTSAPRSQGCSQTTEETNCGKNADSSKQQLGCTRRRLLEKEKRSCFEEEDEECPQNLMMDAAQRVTNNKNVSVNTLPHFILEEDLKERSASERNEKEIALRP